MKRLFLLSIFVLCFSVSVSADTIYITSENYNDTLLTELTADSIIVVDTSLEVEQLIKKVNEAEDFFNYTLEQMKLGNKIMRCHE